jgi:hypothetical protein
MSRDKDKATTKRGYFTIGLLIILAAAVLVAAVVYGGLIFQCFLMAFVGVCFIVGSAFGGLWLGAYICYRGVSIGSGSKESFTGKVPEGEVFRINDIDSLPTEPTPSMDEKTMARADRFLSTLMGGV